MAFIEPMHPYKPNITYLLVILTPLGSKFDFEENELWLEYLFRGNKGADSTLQKTTYHKISQVSKAWDRT